MENPHSGGQRAYAYFALGVLTFLNLLNYMDRFIFAALIPYIKPETGYSDQQLGVVGSAFTIVYTVCAPLFGYLGDRYRRGRLIGAGITIWSLATAATGISTNFTQLLISRSAVGVGEANYASIGQGLLADFFPKKRRGMVMSIFFAALPVGTAFGYLLGGYLGSPDRLGWRHTFFLVGLPGLLTALAAYLMREPQRGVMDDEGENLQSFGVVKGYKLLFSNRGFMLACAGYAAITFALGALVFWAPEWLRADKNLSPESANLVLGLCAVAGGFIGTMLGGVIGDRMIKRMSGAYFWVCAVSALSAAPFTLLAIASANKIICIGSIFIGITLIFLCNGPVNAVLVNLVPATLKATALGLTVVIIHVLGDGISLSLVGSISTYLSQNRNSLPGFVILAGRLFNLDPGSQTLSMALLFMPPAMIAGGVFFWLGMKTPEGKKT